MEQCTDPHDGKLILSGKFPFNIDTLFTMIFTNSKFQLELLAERGTSDYVEVTTDSLDINVRLSTLSLIL